MVTLRGGLEALNLSPLHIYLIRMGDSWMARMHGTQPFYTGGPPTDLRGEEKLRWIENMQAEARSSRPKTV